VPTVFAYRTQQPLSLKPPYDALAGATSANWLWSAFVDNNPAARKAVAHVLHDYDFVVFADRDPFSVPPNACLEARRSTPRFQLFMVRRDKDCS
jgi:hypothetical protein